MDDTMRRPDGAEYSKTGVKVFGSILELFWITHAAILDKNRVTFFVES